MTTVKKRKAKRVQARDNAERRAISRAEAAGLKADAERIKHIRETRKALEAKRRITAAVGATRPEQGRIRDQPGRPVL